MIRRSGTSLIALASLVLLLTSCSYLQPPTGEISMDEAVGIVTEQVLPGAVPKGAPYVCSRLDESIPAGSVIEEAAFETEVAGSARLSPRSLSVSEESFFFFLDLAPRALYAHPVKYIVVAKSGTSHVVEAEWWPKINGVPPAELLGDYPNPSRVIAGNVDLTPPVGNVMTFHLAHASLLGREGFIVVQGAMPNEPLYDEIESTYQNAMNFFSGYRNAVSSVVGLVENHALEIRDEIDRMAGEGRSPITLFIIGHGVANAVWLGGRAITSPGLRAKMAEHPDTLFNLVLGSCYSGSFINVLKALPNVRALDRSS